MLCFTEEKKTWCDLLKLPQVTQGSEDWLAARCLKQTGSDFAALIPKNETYIGHIMKRWQYPDLKYSDKAHCAKSLPRAQYYRKKCLDAIKFKAKKLYEAEGDQPCASISCENYNDNLEGPMQVGKRFENIIRNATIQILGTHISEIGWVENLKTEHAGVSPDGIVHSTVYPSSDMLNVKKDRSAPHKLISYGYGINLQQEENIDLFSPDSRPCTRSFEAKTLCTRQCDQRVPLQYHIQVEKNLYELDLQSAIYSEGGFIEMSVEEWEKRRLDMSDDIDTKHLRLGCLILHSRLHKGDDRYIWPHAYIQTPQQFLEWRDLTLKWYSWKYPETREAPPEVIYFELEKLWITEIELWSDYARMYSPLIDNEIKHLIEAVSEPEKYLEQHPASTPRVCHRGTRKTIHHVAI